MTIQWVCWKLIREHRFSLRKEKGRVSGHDVTGCPLWAREWQVTRAKRPTGHSMGLQIPFISWQFIKPVMCLSPSWWRLNAFFRVFFWNPGHRPEEVRCCVFSQLAPGLQGWDRVSSNQSGLWAGSGCWHSSIPIQLSSGDGATFLQGHLDGPSSGAEGNVSKGWPGFVLDILLSWAFFKNYF